MFQINRPAPQKSFGGSSFGGEELSAPSAEEVLAAANEADAQAREAKRAQEERESRVKDQFSRGCACW